ncbi:MAG: serine/threonine protein kinase, partial [Planctomycetota bacterium]
MRSLPPPGPPGSDTWLARTLLDRGLLDLETLRRLLGEARRGGAQSQSLAARVAREELVPPAALAEVLARAPWAGAPSSPPDPALGLDFGGHRLVRRLGAGGMGAVYLARHEATGASRAIKLLAPRDREDAVRFAREGEALARLRPHPNVVGVHACGAAHGRLYLVMDYAPGGSLAERLKPGPLPPEEAARTVEAVARGLAHAHAAGILHRDLKPANVLFDERGTPRLTDFGLARLAWEGSLTASGTVLGTPGSMPPEQISTPRAVDARSDVYGLGALLYEALTGHPPFRGTSVLAVLSKVLEDAPVPPAENAPGVPDWLDALCIAALEKDLAQRPPSAAAFADALARGASPARQGRSLPLAALAGASLLVLLLAALWAFAAPSPAPTPPEVT